MENASLKFRIRAIAASVPQDTEYNENLDIFPPGEKEFSLKNLGINKRHIEVKGRRASVFALQSAKRILNLFPRIEDELVCLIYITQTPDYITPATSIWMQNELGLGQGCLCFDVNLGCSGYVNGLFLAASILNQAGKGKALVLTSDISSALIDPKDTSTRPIFSDGGAATLIEYDAHCKPSFFSLGNDGAGYTAILKEQPIWKGELDYLKMRGLDILNFTLRTVVKSVLEAISNAGINKAEIDYFAFHQAGWLINEGIRKKIGVGEERYLYSLKEYGNTSSASIPITLIQHKDLFEPKEHTKTLLLCGFGVGLSWGTAIVRISDCLFLGVEEI